MKFVLAFYGTRGDVEPGIAAGRELVRRGHDVWMAVPPDLISSVEDVGIPAVAYGPATGAWLEDTRDFWAYFFRNFWRVRAVARFLRESREPGLAAWAQMSTELTELAAGADLLVTGVGYEELVVNVAEYHRLPLATVLWFPVRVNGHLSARLPAPVIRAAMTAYEWLVWLGVRKAEDAQRRELGLPAAKGPVSRRIAERHGLEVQAYDELCFPGLAAEWESFGGERPFVGTLTLELAGESDEDVESWIAAGTPPICFGFGSIPVESPAETLAMIAAVCEQLGVRALVCAGWTDFSAAGKFDHVKVVGAVNYARIFPACRAVVHHGGAGTTAASLRAGVPTLILWMADVQVIWGASITRMKVGTARRFAAVTEQTLLADLRTILAPDYAVRAREIAGRISTPAQAVSAAADRLEEFAGSKQFG